MGQKTIIFVVLITTPHNTERERKRERDLALNHAHYQCDGCFLIWNCQIIFNICISLISRNCLPKFEIVSIKNKIIFVLFLIPREKKNRIGVLHLAFGEE